MKRLRIDSTRLGRLALVLGCSLSLAAPLPAQETTESRGFSIPNTRAVRALVDSIEGHIKARRWPEALSELQRIIRDHDGDLLGAEFTFNGSASQRPVHRGASEYARRRLLGLPKEARAAYVQLYEADAELLLRESLGQSDRAGLARVGTLFPLTRAATRAWCALGDLELERGNTTEALLAWNRALQQLFEDSEFRVRNRHDWSAAKQRLETRDKPLARALAKRVEFVLASYEGKSDGLRLEDAEILRASDLDRFHSGKKRQLSREMRLPGPGEGKETLPERNPGSWSEPFVLPRHPFTNSNRMPLHAVRSGDLVMVCDSLRVSAVNAYSGRLVWQSEDAPGWDEYWNQYRDWSDKEREEKDFFQGLDDRYALIAPAASDSIVVAPLQIPVTHSSNSKYTSINITRIIPSRRLFAFDVQTGEPLWGHTPPLGWDGESGSFEQRTRICGPPVIAGARVLVPSYRLQGRIDFHVACYDLRTGEYLWSTGLISGQRELNMFGRPEHAFSAPPVRVEGDRVVVLTQLGSIAALDLFSGSILWETLYDQLRLQAAQLHARYRQITWRNAPPVVSNGVVIAAPVDSRDLVALDLESGHLLWSRDQTTLKRSGKRSDLLLGADRNTIYLGGSQLVALASPIDLRAQPEEKWTFRKDSLGNSHRSAWPALGKDALLVPTRKEHFLLDRSVGADEPGVAWSESGNVLLTDGAFFTLNNRTLNGYFEWGTLIERARNEYANDPGDLPSALALASLLTDRGRDRLEDSQADLARPFAEEAVSVLDAYLDREGIFEDEDFTEQLHKTLRVLARVQRYVADPATLATLRRAREFAPDAEELRDTLIEEQALLHDTRSDDWLEVLTLLERECGDLDLACDYLPTGQNSAALDYELVPRLPDSLEERSAELDIPTGLWVRIERSAEFIRRGRYKEAFEDLHTIVRRYASIPLVEGTAFELADAQIARALELGGGKGYEKFEAEAAANLARAREAESLEALKLVSKFYPRSKASREAHDYILDQSIADGDAGGVARILQSELPENWDPKRMTLREAEIFASLASMLRDEGNEAYYRGVLRMLANALPQATLEVSGFEGGPLRARSEVLHAENVDQGDTHVSTFDARCSKKFSFDGSWVFQGYAPGETRELDKLRQLAVFTSRESIMALSSTDPTTPQWTYEFIDERRRPVPPTHVEFSAGRVILYTDEWIVGLNREDGALEWSWSWTSDEVPVSEIRAVDGILLALVAPKGSEPILQAVDAHSGVELWQLRVNNPDLMPRMPLTADGRMVFLPNLNRRGVVVRDLFTGRKTSEFELPAPPDRNAYAQIWIENNLLIEPLFLKASMPESNHVSAFDLDTGELVWRESFDEQGRRELTSIVRHDGESYLILRPRTRSDHQELPGQIMRLHVGFGALQPIGNLQIGKHDTSVDIPVRGVHQLSAPYIFLRSASDDETTTRLRAVHLPHGERWAHSLPVADSDLYSRMTTPALSDSTIVIAYNEWPRDAAKPGVTRLRFIDRATGSVKDARDLPPEVFQRADSMRLVTLGPALILVGQNQMDILE